MTKEEKIDLLNCMIRLTDDSDFYDTEERYYHADEIKETLREAIKALEQQPCDDCVSRQAVLEELQACVDTESMYDENNGLTYICYEDAVIWVEELPPVTPKILTSDDCVSRQAVLDCLTATGLKKFDFILDAREKVNNLPPVTPTHGTCKDCKYNVKDGKTTTMCDIGHRFYMREPSTFYCADFEKRGTEND